jgi:hypothetical protein
MLRSQLSDKSWELVQNRTFASGLPATVESSPYTKLPSLPCLLDQTWPTNQRQLQGFGHRGRQGRTTLGMSRLFPLSLSWILIFVVGSGDVAWALWSADTLTFPETLYYSTYGVEDG